MRINKFLSQMGYCSRRKADELVDLGQVTVNGKKAIQGQKIDETDIVKVKGEQILWEDQEKVYIAYHKPVGIICTADKNSKDTIVEQFNLEQRVYPVGRLDVESSGLIFMTNDGDFTQKVIKTNEKVEKEYVVTVDKDISDADLNQMRAGVVILKKKTLPAKILRTKKDTFKIILVQGLNRQIRRMCEVLGYNVVSLKRVRIGNIELKDMPKNAWRYLSEKEISLFLSKK